MNGQYVEIDVSEITKFAEKCGRAGKGELKRELLEFLDGLGFEMLRIVEDEIVRLRAIDTRLLLNSFHKGGADNVYELNEGDLTLEIGTNVKYAKWVNDGHKQQPGRFIPGVWNNDGKFRYQPGAKTGMVLKANFVEGRHYWENSIKIMEKIFPKALEKRVSQWVENYFSNL